ncbi:MAG TPA: HAD family phosphatase [Terriglobales bacterium]|nr:HAD family phosphatase [Terriglobales bacterium]
MEWLHDETTLMNASGRIRAAVFDMDGVLINSHPTHLAAWSAFLCSVGNEVPDHELTYILEGRTRNEILCHFFGNLTTCELEQYGKQKDEIFRRMEHQIEPIAGVIEFLRTLNHHGISGAIATSASEIRTLSTIERMGIAEHFETVITASDVVSGKPDAMVYRLACERLGVQPAESIAFDDAPAGIQSARSAGMRCIGVSSNGMTQQLIETGAERVIPDFVGLSIKELE